MIGEQGILFGVEVLAGQHPRRGSEPKSHPSPTADIGAVARGQYKTSRLAVLDALRDGPKTDEEIADATALDGNTVRPRRLELLNDKLIADSGTTRLTRRGRDAIVWQLATQKEDPRCGSR